MFIISSHIIIFSYLQFIKDEYKYEDLDFVINGFRIPPSYEWFSARREPCVPYALSCRSTQIGRVKLRLRRGADRNDCPECERLGKAIRVGGHQRSIYPSRTGSQAYHGLLRRGCCTQGHRLGSPKCSCCQRSMAECIRQGSERFDIRAFFIHIGARYRRIRKRPKGAPSPQLYEYKTKKWQGLETLYAKGKINLFYGDESHVCTEGYVPYGW